MRNALLMVVLSVASGCATVDQSRLSESCRSLYNACLNACPTNGRSTRPSGVTGPSGDAISQSGGATQGNNNNFQIDTAACTKRCNDDVKDCR